MSCFILSSKTSKMPLQLVKDLPLKERDQLCCSFCQKNYDNELLYGKFYFNDSIAAHYYCLLFSSGLEQKGGDNDGILGFLKNDIEKEVSRGRKLSCVTCKATGATVGCCNKSCKKTYHFTCGVKSRMMNQYFGAFNSYCLKHQPVQTIVMDNYDIKAARASNSTATCTICHEEVPAYPTFDVLWAPCCKKQSWFHRNCMQQLALSAGYFFKCPICSNNTLFCCEMKRYGIYIPDQDASWELEPNAFQDLVQRHNQCDHPNCICPKGRNHDGDGTWVIIIHLQQESYFENALNNRRWELLLCNSCGSKGIHIGCGRLDWSTMEWDCEDCNLKTRTGVSPKVGPSFVAPSMNTVNITSRPLKRPHSPDITTSSSNSTSTDSDSDVDVESFNEGEPTFPTPISQSIQLFWTNIKFRMILVN